MTDPTPPTRPADVGLPASITVCLFDLDGVLTQTAKVHAAAWKTMFDGFLRDRAEQTETSFVAFDPVADYDEYVDGKPRDDGTRSFLASRGITLPDGSDTDLAGAPTIHGLGLAKNDLVLAKLATDGVEVYPGSVRYLKAARHAGLRCAVVSSSTNCREVLVAAGIEALFDTRVDGLTVRDQGLKGKPAPDTFLSAAKILGATPAQAAVFEDALAGVEAGRAGNFGYVVGVDRLGQAAALAAHGASVVVQDLAELLGPGG